MGAFRLTTVPEPPAIAGTGDDPILGDPKPTTLNPDCIKLARLLIGPFIKFAI
jgi:hypothetical protein